MSALWPDTFVEDADLTFQISVLRKALGPEASEWIETLPRYGYRFSGKVFEVDPGFTSEGAVRLLTETAAPPHTSAFRTRRRLYYWIPAGVLAIAAAYLAFVHLRESPPAERAVTFQISPPESLATPDLDSIILSPTGDRLVFVGVGPDGGRQLWLRSLDSLTASALPGTDQARTGGRSLSGIATTADRIRVGVATRRCFRFAKRRARISHAD